MTPVTPTSGPRDAVPTTPPRTTGSARRTTSIDMTRPDGMFGDVVADVRGRDLVTADDGEARVTDRFEATLTIDQQSGRVLRVERGAGTIDPSALVGWNVRRGFGRALADTFPEEAARRSLAYSTLDDLNGTFLISGYALLREGLLVGTPEQGAERAAAQADICAGWVSGGPIVETLRLTGGNAVPIGPEAPVLDSPADGLSWHPVAPLATTTVRRRRRLDVGRSEGSGTTWTAQSHLRDSYAGADVENVMHEYLVDTTLDASARRLTGVEVQTRVLPWQECPAAAASAQRLVGIDLAEVVARVRADFVGPSTCTHLNSTLRALADLQALQRLLVEDPAA
jgi:hypothetical protein